jgi:EAL and modified HD-GYP domain-containing signal transduction protein
VSTGELFLLGLFSLLPAMLDYPISSIVDKLPLSSNLRNALIHSEGPLAPFLQAVLAYEKRKKDHCRLALKIIHVPTTSVYTLYLESISYAELLTNL